MGNEWRIRGSDDEVIGPLTSSELRERVARGDVTPDSEIQKNDSQWVRAITVNGLFESVGRKPVDYFCPTCGASIDRPPTACEDCGREVQTLDAEIVRASDDRPTVTQIPANGASLNKIKSAWRDLLDRLRREIE